MIWDDNNDINCIACDQKSRWIQANLDACREERRPYIFVCPTMEVHPLQRILVPVTMLEEEVYKVELCTYLARKTGAHLILFKAHDYGSHAQRNINRILTHIRQVAERTGETISYEVMEAQSNSFGLSKEAVKRQKELQYDLLILTASREYGLDDWLFGAPERHAIRRSSVPVMLVNPRADLFSLCD